MHNIKQEWRANSRVAKHTGHSSLRHANNILWATGTLATHFVEHVVTATGKTQERTMLSGTKWSGRPYSPGIRSSSCSFRRWTPPSSSSASAIRRHRPVHSSASCRAVLLSPWVRKARVPRPPSPPPHRPCSEKGRGRILHRRRRRGKVFGIEERRWRVARAGRGGGRRREALVARRFGRMGLGHWTTNGLIGTASRSPAPDFWISKDRIFFSLQVRLEFYLFFSYFFI